MYRHIQLCFLLVRKRQWHQQHAPVSERHYLMEEQSVRLLLGHGGSDAGEEGKYFQELKE